MPNEYNKHMDEKHAKINAKLKPCPFCGGEAKMLEYKMSPLVKIECGKCGIGALWHRNQKELVKKWNTREAEKNNGSQI